MAARCACNSAPRRSASMASRVSASAACSISLSATVWPPVRCPAPGTHRPCRRVPACGDLVLAEFAAGGSDHSSSLAAPPWRLRGIAGVQRLIVRLCADDVVHRSSRAAVPASSCRRCCRSSEGRAPSRAARPAPLLRLEGIVRNPGRRRARDQHAFGQAVVDRVGAQRGAGGAADLDADSGAFAPPRRRSPRRNSRSRMPAESGICAIGQDAEAAEARALDVLARSRPGPLLRGAARRIWPRAGRGCAA